MTTEPAVQPVPDPDDPVLPDPDDAAPAQDSAALRFTVGELKVLQRCTGDKLSKLQKDLVAQEYSAEIIEAFAAISLRRADPNLTWDEAIEAADDVDVDDAMETLDVPPV